METTEENKLIYIKDYLKTYFDEMLIKDIDLIKSKDLRFTLPYILLVSAGIDFLGGLREGFKSNNSASRSCNFIKAWMGRVNTLYKVKGMSEIIYKSARCGSSHQAIYKKGVESSSEIYPRDKHFKLRIRPENKDRIFIHALQFTDDFKKAYKLYRKEYIEQNINIVYENLIGLQNKERVKEFNGLKKYLIDSDLTFKDENEYKPSPSAAPDE